MRRLFPILGLLAAVALPVALGGCGDKAAAPGVNSNGTPTTAAQQVAGDAYTAYIALDVAWLGAIKSGKVPADTIKSVEEDRKAARRALDEFSDASLSGNMAAAQSAFNSAMAAWRASLNKAGVPTPAKT